MAGVLDGVGDVKLAQPIGVLAGIALMAAPDVGDYAGTRAAELHWIAGPVAASLALIAAWEATRGARWPNVAIGAVLIVAPLLVDHPGSADLVGIAAGIALVVSTPFAGAPTHRFGGGWAGLWHDPRSTADERSPS